MKKILLTLTLLLVWGYAQTGIAAEFGVAEVFATDVPMAWDANPAPDIAAYKIYRSSTSGSYAETNLIDTVQHPTVEFTDTMVPDGTWYWVVVPVDTSGNDGPMSAEASKTLDATPPPQVQNFRLL
jgi:hypothetical protein